MTTGRINQVSHFYPDWFCASARPHESKCNQNGVRLLRHFSHFVKNAEKHQSVFADTTRKTKFTERRLVRQPTQIQLCRSTLCFNSRIDPRIALRETRFALRTNTNFNLKVLAGLLRNQSSIEAKPYSYFLFANLGTTIMKTTITQSQQ